MFPIKVQRSNYVYEKSHLVANRCHPKTISTCDHSTRVFYHSYVWAIVFMFTITYIFYVLFLQLIKCFLLERIENKWQNKTIYKFGSFIYLLFICN